MDKEKNIYKKYLDEICKIYSQSESTESSFYPTLKNLLQDYLDFEKKKIGIIIQPKKSEVGIPDFFLKTEKGKEIGYIEAKEPDKNLYNLSKSDKEQLERYIQTLPNLILTNFIDFILFRYGKIIKEIRIAQPVTLKLKTPVPQKIDELKDLFAIFFDFSIPKTTTAENLAKELANRTKFLSHFVLEELNTDKNSTLYKFYNAFQEELIPSLNLENFADMYSQTITYGLFSARIRAKESEFSRTTAYKYIPSTIPLLRSLFYYITGTDLPESLEWVIDGITDVLSSTDINSILKEFHTTKWTDDPVIHFYETFLQVYNPKEREKRGVYYTPAPVVSYIVCSIHEILKYDFNKNDGLADKTVTLLDPAAGTLTFPATAIRLCKKELEEKGKQGLFNQLAKEHILKNFYAFELMVAPYAIGHLKISIVLEDLGYKLDKDERFNLYLTNTLEVKDIKQVEFPILSDLAKEGIAAKEIKDKIPILVITGNPPYSVSSENKSDFIEDLMKAYKEDVRSERNIQPLSDDYIKFLRFAQWKIEKGGLGIVGMITNNSYLSGLIHRGMRKKLLESFDKIYILNLHGSTRIAECCPNGSKDENVFDIMQGVCIALFVKSSSDEKNIYYSDLWGLRNKKYDYLENHNITNTQWQKLEPREPYYFFVPKDFKGEEKYQKFWRITDIFEKFNTGVFTHRDHFIVGFTKEEIKQRMRIFTGNLSDELVSESLNLKDTRDWKLKEAREKIQDENWQEKIYSYSYRVFDARFICYSLNLIDRGCDRFHLMKHFFNENFGLILNKKISGRDWHDIFVTRNIMDANHFRGYTCVFPLYFYPEEKTSKKKSNPIRVLTLLEPEVKYQTKTSNLNQEFINKLEETYKIKISPEQIFYYIYAVLYSNIYRKKYEEFLKIDFPRIPITSNYKLFQELSKLGQGLVELHLLKSPILNKILAKYPIEGSHNVEKIVYDENEKRIYINKDQYFGDIEKDVWEYYIGGYQVLSKWLKERKERKLSLSDIEHYLKVITVIKHTIKLQNEIDKLYPEVEKIILEKLS